MRAKKILLFRMPYAIGNNLLKKNLAQLVRQNFRKKSAKNLKMAMKPSSDNEMRIYLGLQLVSRSFEGKDDSLLCSFSIDIVMAETASVAYDKLNTFGECGSAEEVLFNKNVTENI